MEPLDKSPSIEQGAEPVLFTPSSRCPSAFTKETVAVSPDHPSWLLKRLNEQYTLDNQDTEFDSKSVQSNTQTVSTLSQYDAASQSTSIEHYMVNSSLILSSSADSQCTDDDDDDSPNTNRNDITVVSVTSDDESCNHSAINSSMDDDKATTNCPAVLKDSVNLEKSASSSTKRSPAHCRKLSFTLDSPSPLLLKALREQGLPCPDTSIAPINEPPEIIEVPPNPNKLTSRIPVVKSLLLLKQTSETETTTRKSPKDFKYHSSPKRNLEIKSPVIYRRSKTLDVDAEINFKSQQIQAHSKNEVGSYKSDSPSRPVRSVTVQETEIKIENLINKRKGLISFLDSLNSNQQASPGYSNSKPLDDIAPPTTNELSSEITALKSQLNQQSLLLQNLTTEISSMHKDSLQNLDKVMRLQKMHLTQVIRAEIRQQVMPMLHSLFNSQNSCSCHSGSVEVDSVTNEIVEVDVAPFQERKLALEHAAPDLIETKDAETTAEEFEIISIDPSLKPKFSRVSAAVKGYLTRRLMQTEHVQGIIKTIKDTTACALEIHDELTVHPPKRKSMLKQDAQFFERLINQVTAACHSFHDVFFCYSTKAQMALIATSRELRKHPKPLKKIRTRHSAPPLRPNPPISDTEDNTSVTAKQDSSTPKKRNVTFRRNYRRYLSASPSSGGQGGYSPSRSSSVPLAQRRYSSYHRSPTFFAGF